MEQINSQQINNRQINNRQVPGQQVDGEQVDGLQLAEARFVEIVKTYRAPLLAYVRRMNGCDHSRAEDVVQETFERAWARIDRLYPQYGSVFGWLCRVARNLVVDGHRMRRSRPHEVDQDGGELAVVQDPCSNVVRDVALQQLLAGIWQEHRAVVIEVYLNDRTAEQAAEILQIPVGTVKSRLHHALRKLRLEAGMDLLLAC